MTSERLRLAYQRMNARHKAAYILCGIKPPPPRFMEPKHQRRPEERLRFVANVKAEPMFGLDRGDWPWWNEDKDRCGWFTNDQGESWNDGGGLVWGVIFQLPSHGRRLRFIAGYQFGGVDEGITLDTSVVFTSDTSNDGDGVIELVPESAVRHADRLAEKAADTERAYQQEQELEYAD